MWFGLKMYDLIAGRKNLKGSYYLSKKNALELFPMLRSEKLCGAVIYYDGKTRVPAFPLRYNKQFLTAQARWTTPA